MDKCMQVDYETPVEASAEQVQQVVKDFATAARAAVDAGADGVEIHAGNGYLLQQFMATKTNTRGDAYGGGVAGRCKLLLEVRVRRRSIPGLVPLAPLPAVLCRLPAFALHARRRLAR